MVGVVLDEGIRGRQSNSHFPEATDDHFQCEAETALWRVSDYLQLPFGEHVPSMLFEMEEVLYDVLGGRKKAWSGPAKPILNAELVMCMNVVAAREVYHKWREDKGMSDRYPNAEFDEWRWNRIRMRRDGSLD